MPRPRAAPRCAVAGCRTNLPGCTKNVSMFVVPRDERRKVWLKVMKHKDSESKLMICILHFAKEDVVFNNKRNRVAFDAVPTLRLPHPEDEEPVVIPAEENIDEDMQEVKEEPPDNVIIDLFTEEETVVHKRMLRDTEESTSLLNGIPVKRERCEESASEEHGTEGFPCETNRDVSRSPQTLRTPYSKQAELNSLINLSKVYLSPGLAKLIEVQALLRSELKTIFESKQCSKDMLFFALKLYHSSPNTYKLMQESMCLPSTVKIRQLCRKLTSEINDSWKKVVGARFEHASAEERECVICVAKVRLSLGLSYDPGCDRMAGLDDIDGAQRSRNARYATVVYARGIFSRWHQPLAYAFLPASYHPEKVSSWVHKIISSLFDFGLNVRALVTDFDNVFIPTVSPTIPAKPYIQLNDKQLYFFYDCTQLILKFRDYFRMYNINYKGMTASWDDIEELYEYYNLRKYNLAARLTAEHVKPIGAAARKAKLAVETISTAVATALATAVDLRVLDDSAHGTVQAITAFSTLYDNIHSKQLGVIGNKINPELRFLHDMLVNFDKINFIDKKEVRVIAEPGVLNAFRTDVRAAMALQERMRRAGYNSLPMRAFNNDLIHEFSNRLRTLNGNKDPTGRQFLNRFKRSFFFNIMKSFSKQCKLDEFLQTANEIKDLPMDAEKAVFKGLVQPSDYATLMRVPARADYLLAQCLRMEPCCDLGRVFCLRVPKPSFVQYMRIMEHRFRMYFATEQLSEGVISSILDSLSQEEFPSPCRCFPVLYLKTLYLRFRLATLVKYNNTKFRRGISRDFTMNLIMDE